MAIGTWASIYEGNRHLGDTPLRIQLPAGRHTLRALPGGRGPARRLRVEVTPGGTARVTIPAAAP
jgi:hypothetical protein